MLDDNVWEGVNSLLDNYAGVRENDIAIVVYTSDSREPAAWVSVALSTRGIEVSQVWMARIQDAGFSDRLRAALPRSIESRRLIVITLERDTMSHSSVLRECLANFDPQRCIVIRAISACDALFSQPLRVLPAELSARNTSILEACMGAAHLRIKTRVERI